MNRTRNADPGSTAARALSWLRHPETIATLAHLLDITPEQAKHCIVAGIQTADTTKRRFNLLHYGTRDGEKKPANNPLFW
jgi:hypothetical protein